MIFIKLTGCGAVLPWLAVFFIVDLEKRVYAQKCFDPECRSYRSPWHPLPLLSKGSTDA